MKVTGKRAARAAPGVGGFDEIQVRVARPATDLAGVVAFYGEALGLPVLGSFENHDGHDGVIFGLPPELGRDLELFAPPAPTMVAPLELSRKMAIQDTSDPDRQ